MYSRAKLPIASLAKWYLYKLTAVCTLEFPLVPLGDAPATTPFAYDQIPPFVHQTWSSNRFGRTHARELVNFREANPDLTFVLHDDAAMNAYMRDNWQAHEIYQVFTRARYAQVATDIFRYCLIYQRGGFYFDISKAVRAPIRSLIGPHSTGLITYEHRIWSTLGSQAECEAIPYRDNVVAQYGFGFAPGHPLLGAMIQRICDAYPTFKGKIFKRPKDAILSFTGPEMFTEALREYRSKQHDEALTQAGVDFNGEAIWKLKGAYVRFFLSPPYKHARQDAIVD